MNITIGSYKYLRLKETTLWAVLKIFFGESTGFNRDNIMFLICIKKKSTKLSTNEYNPIVRRCYELKLSNTK